MRRLFPLGAVALALALSASGCSLFRSLMGSVRKPSLNFKKASLADASLSGITVNLVYTLSNPNPVALSLQEVDYRFFVEGKQVVAGRPPKGLRIPASGKGEITLPAQVKFADVAPTVQTFLTRDSARYRAEGSLGLDTPVGRVRLPLSHEGTFEVPKVPKVDFGTPRIGQISASGATVEFPLSLTNRNGFPLPVQDVTGALQIAGANVGSLSTGNLGALAARGTKQLTLPLTVRFLEAGAAAAALRRGNGQVRFSGSLKSGQMAMPVELAEVLEFRR